MYHFCVSGTNIEIVGRGGREGAGGCVEKGMGAQLILRAYDVWEH